MFKFVKKILYILLLCALPCSALAADTGLNGFNVHTIHFSSDASGIFSLYGTQTLGHLKPAFRFSLLGQGDLIKAGNPVNNQNISIVDDMMIGDLSAAIGFSKYVDVGLILPIIFYESGVNVNTQREFSHAGVGDILLDAKVRILEQEKYPIGLGVLSRLSMPTGNRYQFVGWKNPTWELRALVDRKISNFYLVANLGFRIAAKTNVTNRISGTPWNITDDDRFVFGLGTAYDLPLQNRSWQVKGSLIGETVLSDSKQISTPIIINLGIQKKFANGLSVELGGGRGLTNAVGSPSYRVFASVTFDFGRRWREKMEAASLTELIEVVYFRFRSSKLTWNAREVVRKVAELMNNEPSLKVYLTGHADSSGSKDYNEILGLRRAKAVAKELVSLGVASKRISVESLGESAPISSNKTSKGRAKNRRVEVVEIEVIR